MTQRETENFRPPVFKPNKSRRDRFENWFRRFLDLQAGSTWRDLQAEFSHTHGALLDIGCGAQIYRPLMPSGIRCQGIDTQDAKQRFGYEVPDTHYFKGDDWGVADGTFDIALCTEVLEHIPDPAAFLSRVHRCLRPRGRFILTVPFAARWHFIPYDYWRYTPSSLNMLLTNVGFEHINVRAHGNPLTVACYKVMSLILMMLLDQGPTTSRAVKRTAGVLLLPVLGIVACLANATLDADWGDDCLGYTVTAERANRCSRNAE